jgi:hypothetical protein
VRIRTKVMIEAIDQIVADHEKRTVQWEAAVETWKKERVTNWKRDEWPKWNALKAYLASVSRSRGPVDYNEIKAIFGTDKYGESPKMTSFHPNLNPQLNQVKLNNGQTVNKPTGVDIDQIKAIKMMLEAVEDDVVTDTQLSKLGVKNVTPIFQKAVMLKGMA